MDVKEACGSLSCVGSYARGDPHEGLEEVGVPLMSK